MCTGSARPPFRTPCGCWHVCRPIDRRLARVATGSWSATASDGGRSCPNFRSHGFALRIPVLPLLICSASRQPVAPRRKRRTATRQTMFTDRRRVLALLAGAFATPAFAQTAPMTRITAYAFSFSGLGGADIKLAEHIGKPILVVNTASLCGYTPQYAGLQQLWARYHARGLLIVGVPSNDFGARSRAARPTSRRRSTANMASAFPSRRRHRSRVLAHIPSTGGRRASAPSKPRAGTFTSTSLAAMVKLPRFLLPMWN